MTSRKKRAFHFGGASWLLLCAMADGALAQDAAAPPASTQLPEITVTAPSPIVRRKPAVPSRTPARVARAAPGQNRERAAEPQPHPVAAAPQQGVLPVVTDQFATVTVVPNEELRRSGSATLGDLLFSKPGITGSSFAPGASSRPIIRGPRRQPRRHRRERHRRRRRLRSRRGSFRADRSARHQPGRSRCAVRRRLRYGSTSIGGVVSATNNRIPEALPSCPAAPFQSYGLPARRRWRMRNPRLASPSRRARPSARSIAASKAASCSMPAAAISRSTPTPMAARPAITAFPAIPICSTRRGR